MQRTERQRWRRAVTLVDGRAVLLALVASYSLGLVGVSTLNSQALTDEVPEVIIASGADRYPNLTARDWVTYSDHVVVGTVSSERRVSPSQEELERGEGLILREVSVTVDKVIWSAPGERPDAPTSFVWPALGWQFTSAPEYRETLMVGEHEPRLETGNTYVFAIEKPGAYCSALTDGTPTWRGLGAAAVLPLSDDTVGLGEFEGRHVEPAETRVEWAAVGAGFSASMAGLPTSALAGTLNGAETSPQTRAAARADKCAAVQE